MVAGEALEHLLPDIVWVSQLIYGGTIINRSFLSSSTAAMGIDLRTETKLRAGFFGAEPWTDLMREDIEERMGLEAFDIYGLAEIGGPGVSCECEQRCGLHVAEDHFLVEIIDPVSGEPLEPGQTGELVFTTVGKEAFPLLRYRTDDLGSLDLEPCRCGRTLARMSRVHARTDEMFIIHGENVDPQGIAAVLSQVKGVGPHFRVIVDRARGEDSLEVEVELASVLAGDTVGSIERVAEEVTDRLQRLLGFEPTVTIAEPGSFSSGSSETPWTVAAGLPPASATSVGAMSIDIASRSITDPALMRFG